MKKIIIPIILIIIGIAIPFLGMTITPTRDLILGLAPEEAVLKLADKIDINKIDNENKIVELQVIIDNQKGEIENLKSQIDIQDAMIAKTAEDNQSNQNCLKAQQLFAYVPENPKGACRILGPTNIVDAYKTTEEAYKKAKDEDEEESIKCSKKYLEFLQPYYNKYLEAKKLCP